MINSTLFGGAEGYGALMGQVNARALSLAETCSGGCDPWKTTPEGRKRFRALRAVNEKRRKSGLSHVAMQKGVRG